MTTPSTKWSDDAFLNQLRQLGDPEADQCVRALRRLPGDQDLRAQFHQLTTNDANMPDSMPLVADEFFQRFRALPSPDGRPVDMARLQAGRKVFLDHCLMSCLALLLKSVPEGYQAPNLTVLLHRTRDLDDHTYVRLLGVLQMVVNVCSLDGFKPGGKAIITANKLRLLHAGIRHIVERNIPGYRERFQNPVNLEDMLGTIMAFSLLVVEGLDTLRTELTPQEAADYYYVWTVFALLMGIHPPGRRDDTSYVPQSLDEAREFYRSYARRHYNPAVQNPEGVELTVQLIKTVRSLLPKTFLRHFGLLQLPRLYLWDLIGDAAMQSLGQKPVRLFPRWLLNFFPWLLGALWRKADKWKPLRRLHEKLSAFLLCDLIASSYDGEVTFLVPERLRCLRELVATPARGGTPGAAPAK